MILSIKGKNGTLDIIRAVYMSDAYPLFICALAAIGSITGLAFYFAIFHTVLIFIGLLLCDSIRPTVVSLLTFVLQLSAKHAPCFPIYSEYYYTGWRLPVFIWICLSVFAGAVVFIIKNKIYKKISFKDTPMLLSLILLGSAFMLNGAFSDKWIRGDLIFGFSNMVVYTLVFILIYHGFTKQEDSRELARYFSYVAMLIGFVIISELAALYLMNDSVIINGEINKDAIVLGWGIHNLVGVSLSVLIPIIFYGFHHNKCSWLYFTAATFVYLATFLTMSRNALLFASIAYAACVIISCFKGKNKKAMRVLTAAGIMAIGAVALLAWDKVSSIFDVLFERGFAALGRVELWQGAINSFLDNPVFGGGFYTFNVDSSVFPENFNPDVFGPLAIQAHNTFLQLLSATGIVGLVAYLYYRFKSLVPVFKRPTMMKTLMAMSIGALLLGSMLDNFLFNVYPTFLYTVELVIIHKASREEEEITLEMPKITV